MPHSVFQYAVILNEKIVEGVVTEPAKILVEPTPTLAKSEMEAHMKASRAIPNEWADELERITLVVRPF